MSTVVNRRGPLLGVMALLGALAPGGGCAAPDLGLAPFYCNNGSPRCPDDYRCETVAGISRGLCVKEGELPPGGVTDAAPPDSVGDAGVTPAPDVAPPATPRSIVISEFMANPFSVDDTVGEYIELFNLTDQPIDINGWTLTDNGSDSHTINAGGQLIVLPKRYLVLAASIDTSLNGGVGAAYAWDNFTLGDAIDQVLLIDGAGKVADKFAYSGADGFIIAEGASLSLKNPSRDSNAPSNWCVEAATWPGSAGDRGSPGGSPKCL